MATNTLCIKIHKMANPSSWDGFELGIKKFGKNINGFTTCMIDGELVIPLSDDNFSYISSNFVLQIFYTLGTSAHGYELFLFDVAEARWLDDTPVSSPIKIMLMKKLQEAIKTDWKTIIDERIKGS